MTLLQPLIRAFNGRLGRLRGRLLRLLGALVVSSTLLGACAHTLDAGAAGVRVECNVPDATVWIDDLLAGSVKEWKDEGHQLRAGFHRVEIRHPGYYSFFQEVDLPPGSRTVVNAKLRELLD